MYKALSPGHLGHSVRFVDVAEIVARAGYEGYWFNLVQDAGCGIETVRGALKRHNLKGAGFDLPVDFGGDENAYRENLKKLENYLNFARGVGLDRCATWIFPASETMSYDENFEFHRERLAPIARMLDERGMILGLEFVGPKTVWNSMKYPFIHTLDGMLALCGAIGTGNVGILLDAYHWDTAGQTAADFDKFTNERQIAVVHINDAHDGIAMDELPDTSRRLPGATGVLKIAAFFDGLKRIGYTGPVVVEPFEPFLKELPFEEAIATVMRSIQAVWPANAN